MLPHECDVGDYHVVRGEAGLMVVFPSSIPLTNHDTIERLWRAA